MTQGEQLYRDGRLDEAWDVLCQEAAEGSARAMYRVGQYYILGLSHVQKNPIEGSVWFHKGMDRDPLCTLSAHFFLKPSDEDRESVAAALAEAEKEAAGDPVAAVCLSYVYRLGLPPYVQPDTAKGVALLSRAAEVHFWQGLNDLGLLLLNGKDVPKDEKRGAALLEEACRLGLSLSEYHMAYCFLSGTGVAKDAARGIAYYQKAWRHGYALAAVELGMRYEKGTDVKADGKKAFQLYKKAAETGFAEAKSHLGDCYYDGLGVRADRKQALRLYREASDAGDVYGAVRIGQIDFEKQEYTAAFTHFLRAAKGGLPAAQYLIGICLVRGLGVEENGEAGRQWLRTAAAGGSAEAGEALRLLGGA